jgi:hypothetical protein
MAEAIPFTDFSSIRSIAISFFNSLLNANASDFAHDYSELFDKTGAILDANLIAALSGEVMKLLHFCEGQAARVPSLLSKMHCKSFSATGNVARRLRTQQNLEDIFEEALLQSETAVKITIMHGKTTFFELFSTLLCFH